MTHRDIPTPSLWPPELNLCQAFLFSYMTKKKHLNFFRPYKINSHFPFLSQRRTKDIQAHSFNHKMNRISQNFSPHPSHPQPAVTTHPSTSVTIHQGYTEYLWVLRLGLRWESTMTADRVHEGLFGLRLRVLWHGEKDVCVSLYEASLRSVCR